MSILKVLGKKIIIDGETADVADFHPGMSADTYYEVVRLIGGKLLFLQDHLDRLSRSLSGSGTEYPGDQILRQYLRLLLRNNDFSDGNIRICVRAKPGYKPEILCYFISFSYPDPEMYANGVRLLTYPHVRPNPGIKKWDDAFRKAVGRFIREHDIYEAVLLNRKRQVTEGSRSNIFFIDRDNRLVTAPATGVLPGITRKYVLRICEEEGIRVAERMVSLDDLPGMAACFLSGTSPKVLPVSQLDGFAFTAAHPLVTLLMERFEGVLQENLEQLDEVNPVEQKTNP